VGRGGGAKWAEYERADQASQMSGDLLTGAKIPRFQDHMQHLHYKTQNFPEHEFSTIRGK